MELVVRLALTVITAGTSVAKGENKISVSATHTSPLNPIFTVGCKTR